MEGPQDGKDFFDKIVNDSNSQAEMNQAIVNIFSSLSDLQCGFKERVHVNLEKAPNLCDFELDESVSVKDFENIHQDPSRKDGEANANGGNVERFFNTVNTYVEKEIDVIAAMCNNARGIAGDMKRGVDELNGILKKQDGDNS